MANALVIVESPAKVKTINKILGRKYKVTSSMGHLIDLPKSTFGVDVEKDFAPKFIVMRDKQKILKQLKKEAENKTELYIATDPDREGEAIGWNLVGEIGKGKKIFRVEFHEITKDAVTRAFEHPREFDRQKVDAQIARRVLDRIVGYEISPLLWKKVGSRLSAGRVQSVALRLVVDRERAIQNFIPQEYWRIAVDVQKDGVPAVLTAELEKIDDQKPELPNEATARNMVEELKQLSYSVSNIVQREIKRNAPAPFITSTLQQEAFNKLGFNANRTMMLAQQLYEGVELGDGETTGLITYMRTDSTNISKEAIGRVREYIQKNHGDQFLPEKPNVFKSKKSAQEAHEAIRPSDVEHTPESVKKYLDPDQLKLYQLIWKRFVSCQMTPAVYQSRKVEIKAGRYQFGVSGSTLVFEGYLSVYRDDDKDEEEKKVDLMPYAKGDALSLVEVKPTQHFTKPPPRYSEATLVKTLEEEGIGRPSTYAAIIGTLVGRNYVQRDRGYFMATDLGMRVCDLLVEYFAQIMDVGFTARMEEQLDEVEEGKLDWTKLLKEFYGPFKKELDHAMGSIQKTHVFVDRKCPHCNRQMAMKWGRNGRFLSCSGFPECKHAEPYSTGIPCPQPNCEGELVERRSRRGSTFFGCSKYPACTFISNKLPEADKKTNESQAS